MSWHRQGCDSVQQSEELRGSHHLAPSLKNKSALEMQGNGEEVKMADLKSDIFMKDEDKFPPGNYYNVRAGRQVMRGRLERETGNASDLERRRSGDLTFT
jgi:hypothetical protein